MNSLTSKEKVRAYAYASELLMPLEKFKEAFSTEEEARVSEEWAVGRLSQRFGVPVGKARARMNLVKSLKSLDK